MKTEMIDATQATRLYHDKIEFVGKRFLIGKHVFIGLYSHLSSGKVSGTVSIGDNVSIGHLCSIIGVDHKYENRKMLINEQGMKEKGVSIGKDVWIGANSVILPGVKIGMGAVIGAGSVVTRNVPEYEVWVGNPARKVKERK